MFSLFDWNIKEKPFMSIFGLGGGSSSPGNSSSGGGGSLFPFTSFVFNPGGGSGRSADSLSEFLSNPTYDTGTYSWLTNTDYFAMPQNGFQLWTVPEDGDYIIEAKGASGGSVSYPGNSSTSFYARGGGGATLTATFSLTAGDKLLIATGQHGTRMWNYPSGGAAGGGGGTFVLKQNASTISDVYMIAGGGGGASFYSPRIPTAYMYGASSTANNSQGSDARPGLNPLPTAYGAASAPGPGGGSRTLGGTDGYGGGGALGGGGGAYFGPGGTTPQYSTYGVDSRYGHGYASGNPLTPDSYRLRGGYAASGPSSYWGPDPLQGQGGFGGGGAAQVTTGYAGGGGGYSGGGGGTFRPSPNPSRQQSGGAGGNWIDPAGTNITRTNGSIIPSTSQGIGGQVTITKV